MIINTIIILKIIQGRPQGFWEVDSLLNIDPKLKIEQDSRTLNLWTSNIPFLTNIIDLDSSILNAIGWISRFAHKECQRWRPGGNYSSSILKDAITFWCPNFYLISKYPRVGCLILAMPFSSLASVPCKLARPSPINTGATSPSDKKESQTGNAWCQFWKYWKIFAELLSCQQNLGLNSNWQMDWFVREPDYRSACQYYFTEDTSPLIILCQLWPSHSWPF